MAVDEAQGGAGIADFCGVEFGAYGFEGGVGDGVGLAVDFDAQFVACGVGAQVDAGGEEGAHKASGVVAGLVAGLVAGFAQGADFTNPEAVGQPGATFGELECALFSVGMGDCLRFF